MAKSMLDVYNENISELRLDTITRDAALAQETPYSMDQGFDLDDAFINAPLQGGWTAIRGGTLDTTTYESTVRFD